MNQLPAVNEVIPAESGLLYRKGIRILLFIVVVAMLFITPDPTSDIKYVLLSCGAYILTALLIIRHWSKPLRRPALFLELLLVFLALHMVASMLGNHFSNSFVEFRKFWTLFLLYLVASQAYRGPRHIRRTMMVLCLAVAVSSVYALVCQGHGLDPLPWSDRDSDVYTNLPGTFGNPNFAAHTLILATIMALYLATRVRAVWCLGLAALFLVHLGYTHQRAGWIALAASAALVLVATIARRYVRKPVRAVVVTVLVTALLGIAGLGTVMALSNARNGSIYPLDLSLLVRYKSYCSAGKMILARPLFGYGTGNYKIEYPAYWTPYEQRWFANEFKMNTHVHNDPLEIAVDAGLPAAGVYLAFLMLGMCYALLLAFREEDRHRRRLGYALAALFCAFFVDGLFGFNLRVPVSAAVLFLAAGFLEGAWSDKKVVAASAYANGFANKAWRVAVLGVGLVFVLLDTGVYASQVLMQHSYASTNAGKLDDAVLMTEWGESLAPGNWMFARQRGLIQSERKNWDGAIDAFNKSLAANPKYVLTLLDAARAELGKALSLLVEQRDTPAANAELDNAAAHAQQARQLVPMLASAEDLLGRISSARALAAAEPTKAAEEWKSAEQHFVKAIEDGAKNTTEIYDNLAQVRVSLNDLPGAEDAMLRATQADALDVNWIQFYNFALTSRQYQKFLHALQERIRRLSERTPPDDENLATAYLWLATIRMESAGDVKGAETAFRNAIQRAPDRPEIWRIYAQFATANDRLERFKKFLIEMNSQLLSEGKKPLPHIMALSMAWKSGAGKLVEASALLGETVQGKIPIPGLTPTGLEMKWAIQMLVEEAKNLVIAPVDGAITLLHLAIVSAAVNEFDLANELFPQSMTDLPQEMQPVAVQHWADALVRTKRPEQAINLLQSTVLAMPENADVRISLARTLATMQRYGEAKVEYQAVLNMKDAAEDQRRQAQSEMEKLPEK